MIRRGQTTTFQERLEIIERATAGQSDPEIAAALGCSVWTVRKWRRRGCDQGALAYAPKWAVPAPDRSALFQLSCVIQSCRCVEPIQAGGQIRFWQNCVLMNAGRTCHFQAAPVSRPSSKRPN